MASELIRKCELIKFSKTYDLDDFDFDEDEKKEIIHEMDTIVQIYIEKYRNTIIQLKSKFERLKHQGCKYEFIHTKEWQYYLRYIVIAIVYMCDFMAAIKWDDTIEAVRNDKVLFENYNICAKFAIVAKEYNLNYAICEFEF